MATIEERAIERGKESCESVTKVPRSIYSPFGIGYYLGATEQREIDIEKACEWFCDKCVHKKKKEVCRICKSKEYIRKAMEE